MVTMKIYRINLESHALKAKPEIQGTGSKDTSADTRYTVNQYKSLNKTCRMSKIKINAYSQRDSKFKFTLNENT